MQLLPINCPNCGAGIQIEGQVPLANCRHCETSIMIEWPTSRPTPHYRIGDTGNPFVACPHCSAQQLHDRAQVNQEVTCPQCQGRAVMPPLAEFRMVVCSVCGRIYSSIERRCPDHERHPPR